jgi:hypothetical protein
LASRSKPALPPTASLNGHDRDDGARHLACGCTSCRLTFCGVRRRILFLPALEIAPVAILPHVARKQVGWWCILEGCPLRCADLFPARAPRHRSGDRRDRKPCAETNWPTWASSRRSRRQEDASRRIAFRETRTDEPQRRGDCFGCGPTVQGSANESFFGAGPARARSPFGGWQGAGGRCSWAA